MDDYELTARKTLALCASLIIVSFLLAAWVVVGIAMWLLASAPNDVGPQAGSLVAPLAFLLAGAVGTLAAAGTLFWLARGWVRGAQASGPQPPEPALVPAEVDAA